MERDNSKAMIDACVSEVKSAIALDEASQAPKYSGHDSADYNDGPDKSSNGPNNVGE
jgi:hypothetical protein